jgi:phage/plasmid-like protein (TIGR03299 family)
MSADVETMMYTGEVPWHGFGNSVAGVLKAQEAIVASGLDWAVDLTPIFMDINGANVAVPRKRAVRRTTDNAVMGVVSEKGYFPVQNEEAFTFFDSIVDSGDAKYETAGSLSGGKMVWMTAKVGDSIQIAGDDAHDLYLLLVNKHDGTGALKIVTTLVRAVCKNTVTAGIRQHKSMWSINHRKPLEGRVADARNALQMSFKYVDAFEAEVQKMIETQITADAFRDILEKTLPEQKFAQEKKIDTIVDLFQTSDTIIGTSAEGNVWGASNALSQFLSHRESRTEDARMTSNIFGQGAQQRNQVHDALMSLV